MFFSGKKLQWISLISFLLLINSMVLQSIAYGATSGVTITYVPYLSFQNLPDSFILDSISVPLTNINKTSDTGNTLPVSRYLDVRDTRGCGGFNLQLEASPFSPGASLNNTFRVITTVQDAVSESAVNGVKYLTGFTGPQTVSAPLNVATSDFSDFDIFTDAPFNTTDNILNGPIDVLQAPLTAPAGRDGTMHVSMSFALMVPALTIPGNHFTTLTFTLSDDTSGTCP